jgi:hypothetical protein
MKIGTHLALLCLLPAGLLAQSNSSRSLVVVDPSGAPVPFAVVVLGGAPPQIADDSGRLTLRLPRGSVHDLWVRRIGYREYRGRLAVDSTQGRLDVTLSPLAVQLATVSVEAARSTPLARTGFYDRVERTKRGAFVGEFISPEELDQMNHSRVSDLLRGRQHVRVRRLGDGTVHLLGRGDCPLTIVIDGQRANNTAQDDAEVGSARYLPTPDGRNSRTGDIPVGGAMRVRKPSVDELVGGREVMAIEVYASLANAPAELIPLTGGGSCGIIAIWTGGRR